MAPTATEEVKGIPPGLTAEPLEQPKTAAVRGVPAGLIAEPIEQPLSAAGTSAKQPDMSKLSGAGDKRFVSGVPKGVTAQPIIPPLTTPETDQQKFYEQAVKNGFTPERAAEVTNREFGSLSVAPPPVNTIELKV